MKTKERNTTSILAAIHYLISKKKLEPKEIQKLIDDSQLRLSMGKNGRMRAEQLFSWKRIAEETASVYESVI